MSFMKHNFNVLRQSNVTFCRRAVGRNVHSWYACSNRWKHRWKPSSVPAVSCWPLNLSKQKATEWAVIFHDVTGTRCQTTRLRLWHTVTATVGKTAHTIFGSTVILWRFRLFSNNTTQIIKCTCIMLIHFQWPCKPDISESPLPPMGPMNRLLVNKNIFLLSQTQPIKVLKYLWCILFTMFSPAKYNTK